MVKVKASELLNCIKDIITEDFDYLGIEETEEKIIVNGYKKTDLGYESCEFKTFKTFKNCEI